MDAENAAKKIKSDGNENGTSGVENAVIEEADTEPASMEIQTTAAPAAGVSIVGEVQPPPRRRRRDNEPTNEEAFKYLSPTHPELESIYNFYELHEDFPRDRFLVRNPSGDPVKGIYYSSQLAKDILTANEGRGMKFVHAGVKMFMKQDSQGQDNLSMENSNGRTSNHRGMCW